MSQPTESLGYVCKATVQRHNRAGQLYRHRWATGYQELVFDDHAKAAKWAANRKAKYTGPHKG